MADTATWRKHVAAWRASGETAAGEVVPGLECRVGGLDTARPSRDEFVDWVVLHDLRFGILATVRRNGYSGSCSITRAANISGVRPATGRRAPRPDQQLSMIGRDESPSPAK